MDSGALIGVWLGCALIAWLIGASKGKAGAGLFLGLLLGVIGLVIVLVMAPNPNVGRKPCPQCAEMVMPTAKVCPHCGTALAPAAPTT